MVMVIIKSDGDLVEAWTLAPAVYLAIFSVVANVLLRYTFSRGVDITWWTTALESNGATVSDLHNIWLHFTSLRSALLSPLNKTFTLISFASILLALVPANAPLAQRASRTTTLLTTHKPPQPLRISALQALNGSSEPTGQISGRGNGISYINPSFASILQSHLLSSPIPLNPPSPLCDGHSSCKGIIHAAGYAMSCTNSSKFFDKTSRQVDETAADGTSAFESVIVFGPS